MGTVLGDWIRPGFEGDVQRQSVFPQSQASTVWSLVQRRFYDITVGLGALSKVRGFEEATRADAAAGGGAFEDGMLIEGKGYA